MLARTSSELYPNLYVFIVGNPGVGKNRIIRVAKRYMQEIPEFHFAPTSLTGAASGGYIWLASKAVYCAAT